MKIKIVKYKSSNNSQDITARIYYNDNKTEYKGVIQVIHGMFEHSKRYHDFAHYFTDNGYIVAVNDHLGHGESINEINKHGHFGDNNGDKFLIKDVHKFNNIIKKLHPDLPLLVYAHSMGGLICINYLSVYKPEIDGLILLGSHLNQPSNYFFNAIVNISSKFCNPKRSALVFTLIQNSIFSVRFLKSKDGKYWTSRKSDYIRNTDFHDPSPFCFTYAAYLDVFKLSLNATPKTLASGLDKDTPVLLMSGCNDPVTNYTKLTFKKYMYLIKHDFTDVSIKVYNNARHNLINEINRDEVLRDILKFYDRCVE